jgi:hypothetical protein
LWIANGGNPNDSIAKGVLFPVPDPSVTYSPEQQKTARENKVKLFGGPAAALMDRLQADDRGNPATALEMRPLALLHKLDIWDKHRRLNIVAGTIRVGDVRIGEGSKNVHITGFHLGPSTPAGTTLPLIPTADGAVLLRFTIGTATPDVKVEDQFRFFVAFEQEGPGKGEPLIETLDQLITFVDESLSKFSPLLPG